MAGSNKLEKHIFDFNVAAISTAEVSRTIIHVEKGDIVLTCYGQKLVISTGGTTPTISLGWDSGATLDDLIADTATSTGTAGDIVTPVTANLPKIFTADADIKAEYAFSVAPTGSAGSRFIIWILRHDVDRGE